MSIGFIVQISTTHTRIAYNVTRPNIISTSPMRVETINFMSIVSRSATRKKTHKHQWIMSISVMHDSDM